MGYFELGMIDDALAELRLLPPKLRQEPEVLEMEAAIGQQTGRWNVACDALAQLCSQPDARVDSFVEWGCCLYELGRTEECRCALLQAPAERETHGIWHFHLACYQSLLGSGEEARRLIHRALQLEPCLRRRAEANENLIPFLPPPAAATSAGV